MSQVSADHKVGVFRFTTTRLVIAAVLVALTIVLSFIPLPVPNATRSGTLDQLPTTLGSVIEGPLVGMIAGLLWGILSFASGIFPFTNPLVSILPRVLVGVTPWLVYIGIKRGPFSFLKAAQGDVAAGMAGLVGSATNTILVLGIAVLSHQFPPAIFLFTLPQAIMEALVCIVVTIIVTRAVDVYRNRVRTAADRKKREELPY